MKKPNFDYYVPAINSLLDLIQRADEQIKLFLKLGGSNQFVLDQLNEQRNNWLKELDNLVKDLDNEIKGIVLPKAA